MGLVKNVNIYHEDCLFAANFGTTFCQLLLRAIALCHALVYLIIQLILFGTVINDSNIGMEASEKMFSTRKSGINFKRQQNLTHQWLMDARNSVDLWQSLSKIPLDDLKNVKSTSELGSKIQE